MTLEEIKKALEEVQRMCQANPFCGPTCPFHNTDADTFNDCFIGINPENWELDKIDIKGKG